MQKKELNFAADLDIDELKRKPKRESTSKDEKSQPKIIPKEDNKQSESFDMSFFQELMKEDEKFMDMLVKTNDKAAMSISTGNVKEALVLLERMERILEFAAASGKVLDRNLVIVCLYNIACAHQSLWVLEKCSKYIDAVIFNLNQSIKQDDASIITGPNAKLNMGQNHYVKSIKLRKLHFLQKVYLQHCAVLSQLSKHEGALETAKKAQTVMVSIINECLGFSKDMKRQAENSSATPRNIPSDKNFSALNSSMDKRLNNSIFKDEVPYIKFLLEFASPFLEDFSATVEGFSVAKTQDILTETRKSLFNWKNNPENNEKYLRKEFKKSPIPNDIVDENRSLLGVQQQPEWLENLNIGSIMHMKPLKYKDYAQKRELVNEITKEALQEKTIFQSLIYFTTATEMRFQEMANNEPAPNAGAGSRKVSKEELKSHDLFRNSEAFHLKAIELVCRYITGPCPYINHLITSYQKHYNQDLEVIPEESFISVSENVSVADAPRKATKSMPPQKLQNVAAIPLKSEQPKAFHDAFKEEKHVPVMFTVNPNNSFKVVEKVQEKTEKPEKLSERIEKMIPVERSVYERFDRLEKKPSISDKLKENQPKTSFSTSRDLNHSKEHLNEIKYNTNINTIGTNTLSPKNTNFALSSKPSYQTSYIFNENRISNVHDDITNMSPSRVHLKKGYNIPNLNLGKMSNDKNLSYTDRNNSSASLGFRSERSIYKGDLESNLTEPNQEKSKDKNDPNNGINFFFYKNFNKFIQNLYIQDEQLLKKKFADKKSSEKFLNNPYKKEIDANVTRKSLGIGSSLTKKPSSASSNNKSTFVTKPSTSDGSSSKRTLTLEDEKKSSVPPKSKEEITATLLKESAQSTTSKSMKSLKPFTYKSIPHLDVGKFRYESLESKTFFTPREHSKN